MKKLSIQEVVNDPEWQALRRSFLGTWKEQPCYNLVALKMYLGDYADPLKRRRVLNYLTGSGFRTRKICPDGTPRAGVEAIIQHIKRLNSEVL